MLLVAAYNSCSSLALVVLLPESEKDADLVSVQLLAAVKSIALRQILDDIMRSSLHALICIRDLVASRVEVLQITVYK